MNKSRLIRNTVVYFLLITGFILFYVIHIERFLDSDDTKESSSKVDFIYQQF